MRELNDLDNSSGEESVDDIHEDGEGLDPLDIKQMNINDSLTTIYM